MIKRYTNLRILYCTDCSHLPAVVSHRVDTLQRPVKHRPLTRPTAVSQKVSTILSLVQLRQMPISLQKLFQRAT